MGFLANAMKQAARNARIRRRRQHGGVSGIECLEQRTLLSAAMGMGPHLMAQPVPLDHNQSGWVAEADDSTVTREVATSLTEQHRQIDSATPPTSTIDRTPSTDNDVWLDFSVDLDTPSGFDDPDLGTPVVVETPNYGFPCTMQIGSVILDPSTATVIVNGTICDDVLEIEVLEGAGTDGDDLLHVVLNDGPELSVDLANVSAIAFHALEGNDFFDNDSGVASSAWGDEGADVFYGGSGVDVFYGGDQDDLLFGGAGNDHLEGGDGDDLLSGQADDDRLHGNDGDDELIGGNGNDGLYGHGDDDLIRGNDGDDTIEGSHGNDSLYGGDNDDQIDGGEGNDCLDGGSGDDFLQGGSGEDDLSGQAGDDELHGGDDDDVLDGGSGDDTIDAGNGNDELHGGLGDDVLSGGNHEDSLYGDADDDILNGGNGRDVLYGGEGNDDLYGNGGADELFGMDGDDGLFGGDGKDSLDGGDNEDRFLYQDDDTLVDKTSADAKIRFFNGDGDWSEDEIEAIDQAFSVLHHFTGDTTLLKRKSGLKMRFKREGESNGGSCNNAPLGSNNDWGRIRIYDETFAGCKPVEHVVFHELGHNWEDESSIWSDFKDLSGWTKRDKSADSNYAQSGDGNWWYDTSATFASSYGTNVPQDDFAEVFALFFMNEAGLGFDDGMNSTTDGMANNATIIARIQDKYDLFEGWLYTV